MKREQRTKTGWGEGWLLAAALGLALVLCLLNAVNRLPQKNIVAPVHCVETDLYDAVLVDINAAERERLMTLPFVGEVMADRIIAARPFSSVDDLLCVEGIGEGVLEEIRPLVKCG